MFDIPTDAGIFCPEIVQTEILLLFIKLVRCGVAIFTTV